jgi:hypothetical protein
MTIVCPEMTGEMLTYWALFRVGSELRQKGAIPGTAFPEPGESGLW